MSDIVERLRETLAGCDVWYQGRIKTSDTLLERFSNERKESADEITRLREENKMAFEAVGDVVKANDDLREKNEKLRIEVMSDYNEGWEEGIKAERERCAKIAESYFSVQGSYAMHIAAAIRENE